MAPRITLNLTADDQLEIWLNPEGRDLLVKELQGLSKRNDHFHFGPSPSGEVEVSSHTYRSNDKLLEYGKVLFRPDEWDVEHFPHVMGQSQR
jgi:hypothetical protein